MKGFYALLFLFSATAMAGGLPACPDVGGRPMPLDNQRVLDLKRTTRSGQQDRGYIQGTLVGVFNGNANPDRRNRATGHYHLDVFIGNGQGQTGRDTDIEIVYNDAFGQIQGKLATGMEVVACGDFINSSQQNGHFPPSPDGAIIHWVHMAPRPGHVSGFLAIDGVLYGQTNPNDRGSPQDENEQASLFSLPLNLASLLQ